MLFRIMKKEEDSFFTAFLTHNNGEVTGWANVHVPDKNRPAMDQDEQEGGNVTLR
jgi:hypothetical protein